MKSILNEITSTYIIEKSKFITHINHVENREEAECYIKKIKEEYKDATHNVPCFILPIDKWCSDDGEPSGTAGQPILQLLEGNDIYKVCVVVTRYFGGIKLGTGGLARAYQNAVKECLENAIFTKEVEVIESTYTIDYQTYTKIEKFQDKFFEVKNPIFLDNVTLTFTCLAIEADRLLAFISDISKGSAKLLSTDKKIVNKKI